MMVEQPILVIVLLIISFAVVTLFVVALRRVNPKGNHQDEPEAQVQETAVQNQKIAGRSSTWENDGRKTEIEKMINERRMRRGERSAGFCPKCGHAVQQSDLFCANCGEKVG